jgi:hypothetical protein
MDDIYTRVPVSYHVMFRPCNIMCRVLLTYQNIRHDTIKVHIQIMSYYVISYQQSCCVVFGSYYFVPYPATVGTYLELYMSL